MAMQPNIPDDPAQAVLKMNQTLGMMGGQPEIVCQLFAAFTAGGVIPNVETYGMVVRACTQQGLIEPAGMLLEAAVTGGIEVGPLLPAVLEATSNLVFVTRWGPAALDAGLKIPSKCFSDLFRCRATTGVSAAVELFQQLLRIDPEAEESAAIALVLACGANGQLEDLATSLDRVGCTGRVMGLLQESQNKREADATSPVRPPPGLEQLPATGYPSSPVSADPMDEALMLADDATLALQLLQQAAQCGTVSESAYKRVIDLAIAQGMLSQAQQVLSALYSVHGTTDEASYMAILNAHIAKGHFDKAEKVFEEMQDQYIGPDTIAWNALLKCAAHTGRHDKAWNILAQMIRECIQVDKVCVSMLLKNISEKTDKSKVRRSIEIVEKFIDAQGADQDDILFNSLLDACCRIKDIGRLEKTLQRMKVLSIKPSPSTFGTLIKAYGQRNDLPSVMRTWNAMKAADVGMNTVTYGCMLDACVKTGCFDKAEEVFAEMKTADQHRNTIVYTTMIKSYSKQKKLRKALRMLEEMKIEDVARNCVTFNSLIDASVRCRDLIAATKLLEEMKENDILPDLITYSTLIKGFCDQGDIEVSMTLLARLKEHGMKPDEILYNSLLEGCVKANAFHRGLELFAEMTTDKVPMSNITFSIMVKMFTGAGRLDQALALVTRMETNFGVKPTNVVFSCLVKCCVSSNRVATAAQLLLGLPMAARVQPDQIMYASVIPGLVSSGELDLALNILEQFCSAPASEQTGARAPRAFELARSIFEHCSAPMHQERARNILRAVRYTRSFSPDQENTLDSLVRSSVWTGGDFVPSMAPVWSGGDFVPGMPYGQDILGPQYRAAAAQALWKTWEDVQSPSASAVTPLRTRTSGAGVSPHAASPNVMRILLQNDAASGEKQVRKTTKKPMTTPVKSPLKMAPMVTGKLAANTPLEFSVKKSPVSCENKEN